MNPLLIAQLALGIGATLAEAWEKHARAKAALDAMLAENRGPTQKEISALKAAGEDVDKRLAALLE